MGTVDDSVVRIAERRLHLVTDDEAQQLGLTSRAITRRLKTGSLHRVVPGVLSTASGPYDVSQRELALCLSDPQIVLSHISAAGYWGFRRAPKDRVEVTVPKGARVGRLRAVVHYSNSMPDHHVVELIDGGRVTSVARTVFDLGGALDADGHLSVIEDVRNKGLCTDAELGEAGLPGAIQQHPVVLPNGRTAYLDLAYPDCRLDIEIDHSEWHATASAVEQDKARDLGLALLGWERLRFTDRAVEGRLRVCVAMVRAVLDLRTARPYPPAA